MTTITLRHISPQLLTVIRRRAAADGLSLNKTVLCMLEEAAGLRQAGRELHNDLDHLAGSWSEEEADSFDAALVEQRSVDQGQWT